MSESRIYGILVSNRDLLPIADRAGLLEQDLMWLKSNNAPVYFKGCDPVTASEVHDFNQLCGWVYAVIKTCREHSDKVHFATLNKAECAVAAWKRGRGVALKEHSKALRIPGYFTKEELLEYAYKVGEWEKHYGRVPS